MTHLTPDSDDPIESEPDILTALRAVTFEMSKMRRQMERSRRLVRWMILVTAIAIVSTVVAVVVGVASYQQSTCVKQWATKTSTSNAIIRTLGTNRFDAFDKIVVHLNNKAQATADYLAYLKADAAYHAGIKKYPVEQVDSFNCGFFGG